MVFFTTPELLEIGGLPFVSPYEKPTRTEALRYYRKVVDAYDLQIAFDETVLSIEREQEGPDMVFAVQTRSSHGVRRVRQGLNVVLAIGYYDHPVLLGIPGEDLAHVQHYYSEPYPHYRQRTIVVGGGNSAAETSLELHRAGAFVTLVHRWPELKSTIKYWVKPDIENRIKEGSIKACFESEVKEIAEDWICVQNAKGEAIRLPNEFVFALTGYHPDVNLLRNAGVEVDPQSYRPACNPQTLESNVPGLYLAGVVISGRQTNEIFIENGRFHGKQIVADIKKKLADRP